MVRILRYLGFSGKCDEFPFQSVLEFRGERDHCKVNRPQIRQHRTCDLFVDYIATFFVLNLGELFRHKMVFPNPDRSSVGMTSIPENLRVCDGAILMDEEESNSVDAWNLCQCGSATVGLGLSAQNVLSSTEVANSNRLASSSSGWQISSTRKRSFSAYRGGKKNTSEGSEAFRIFVGSSASASSSSSRASAAVGLNTCDDSGDVMVSSKNNRRCRDGENVANYRSGTTSMDPPASKRRRSMPVAPSVPSAVFALPSYEGAPIGFGGGYATRVMSNPNNALQLPETSTSPPVIMMSSQCTGNPGPLSFAFRANAQY